VSASQTRGSMTASLPAASGLNKPISKTSDAIAAGSDVALHGTGPSYTKGMGKGFRDA